MTSLSFAEKTRIGAILRRVMLDDADVSEVQMTKTSSPANQVEDLPGMTPTPAIIDLDRMRLAMQGPFYACPPGLTRVQRRAWIFKIGGHSPPENHPPSAST